MAYLICFNLNVDKFCCVIFMKLTFSMTSFLSNANDLCLRMHITITAPLTQPVIAAIMLDLSGLQLLKYVPSFSSREENIRQMDSREICIHLRSRYLQSPARIARLLFLSRNCKCSMSHTIGRTLISRATIFI